MKKTIILITSILLLVAFPLFASGALADFFGQSALPITSVLEPVNILLFGIGLTFAGSRR